MPTQTLFARTRPLAAVATSLATSLTIGLSMSACGGGGSDAATVSPPPTTPTAPTSSLPQGRWVSSGLNPAYTAIMVPAPTGANTPAVDTLWALAQDASTLIRLQANGAVQTAGAVTGHVYALGTGNVTAVSGGSYTVASLAASPTTTAALQISIQPLLGGSAVFERTDAMGAALSATQANGRWQADLGSAKVNWSVSTAGANVNNLSGTSSTGCAYSGQSTVVSTQSLYKVQFTETCSGGTTPLTQTFTGIATLNADASRMTVVASNDSASRASALLFTKQP